jgi:hypothetical protein
VVVFAGEAGKNNYKTLLSRIHVNNQMVEIRARDLRFSKREVDLFLNGVMGLSLLNQVELFRPGNRLGTVLDREFLQNNMHIKLNRPLGKKEFFGNLPVGATLGN